MLRSFLPYQVKNYGLLPSLRRTDVVIQISKANMQSLQIALIRQMQGGNNVLVSHLCFLIFSTNDFLCMLYHSRFETETLFRISLC